MPIVLDANVAVDWFLPNMNDVASAALDLVVADGAVVPALWRWEVQDVLRRLDLAGKLTQKVDIIRDELQELPITVDDELTSVFGDEATVSADDHGLVAAVEMAKLPPIL